MKEIKPLYDNTNSYKTTWKNCSSSSNCETTKCYILEKIPTNSFFTKLLGKYKDLKNIYSELLIFYIIED